MANSYTDRKLLEHNFQGTDATKTALNQKTAAEDALKNYGAYTFNRQADLDNAINSILNRKDFTYDLNGDALYNQYKDQYRLLGQQAMQDTMGQAAALTGGYGNSYAATAGNQAYQGYMQQLTEKIPELYQLALDKYNADGERLAQNYSLLNSEYDKSYGEYMDTKNALIADRDYYSNNYDSTWNREYTNYTDQVNSNNTQYWNEYNAGYQAEQDAIANALNERQVAVSEANARLAQEQWNYQKSQPASVDYAITNYSDVPKSIRNSLNDIAKLALNEDFVGPISEKQKEKMISKLDTYINGLVTSQQLSPTLGDALMSEYMDIIERR